MKKRRIAASIGICIFFAAALAGCFADRGGQPKPEEAASKVNLVYWDENAGPSRTPVVQELIRRFEKENPDIHVEYKGIPVSINKTRYDIAAASGDLPDAGGINGEWVADLADKGVLLPLDSYFAEWPGHEQIGPSFIAYNRSIAPDGKLYQIPSTYYLDVFWYRTDWLAEAGLAPPQTWEDFFRDVKLLTDSSKGRYGYSLRGGEGSVTQLTALMYAYSGITSYFREDGTCTVNDPLHVEFLKRYLSLYRTATPTSDIISGYKEVVASFDAGRTAMIQHNLGSYRDHLKALGQDRFSSALLPPAVNGKRTVFGNANGYGIMRTTRHPDEAWRLISFLLSEESQIYWNSEVGQLPTNLNAWDNPYFRSNPVLKEAIAAFRSPDTAFMHAAYELPDYPSLIRLMEPEFQQVIAGDATVEHFLDSWAQLMENSRSQHLHAGGAKNQP